MLATLFCMEILLMPIYAVFRRLFSKILSQIFLCFSFPFSEQVFSSNFVSLGLCLLPFFVHFLPLVFFLFLFFFTSSRFFVSSNFPARHVINLSRYATSQCPFPNIFNIFAIASNPMVNLLILFWIIAESVLSQ